MSGVQKIKRILVANRGEIACRIFRTAKELGIETVAVYSEADANALHSKMADQSVCIGPAPVSESYLCGDTIIDAAKKRGADAIHPGYGFLSENAEFAASCAEAGITFIGPGAEAIELMGNKAAAKRRMLEAGVPCIPGYQGNDQSFAAFEAAAREIGFPIMVKAAAGGGGRGMRLVECEHDLEAGVNLARSEAESAFGSGELILEKAVVAPRHVEIQIFADRYGNYIHLGERDCSIQRRHQKVIEEAPCPVMTPDLRDRMGQAAVNAARSIDYVGAGTVEFLLDAENNFYFLEMNTRLQVEHPVTEMVTGLDLVSLQIAVAEGAALPLEQSDVEISGHAIEVRLYAEDVANDFLPATGGILDFYVPEYARVDAGIGNGSAVSPFYDPMLAKIIVHADTRSEAVARLAYALNRSSVLGLETNLSFLLDCLNKPDFETGSATTRFIEESFPSFAPCAPSNRIIAAAAVIEHCREWEKAQSLTVGSSGSLKNWASATPLVTPLIYGLDGTEIEIFVCPNSKDTYQVNGPEWRVDVTVLTLSENSADLMLGGKRYSTRYALDERSLHLSVNGHSYNFQNRLTQTVWSADEQVGGHVTAPMHGVVVAVNVSEGADVEAGDCLAVLEAMKMQHQIVAQIDGQVSAVCVAAGEQIASDALMFELTEKEAAE